MQISTRDDDFIVDTLKLRIYIGPHLREVFKDPKKKKVDYCVPYDPFSCRNWESRKYIRGM